MGTVHYPAYDPTALFAGDFPHISRPVTIAQGNNAAPASAYAPATPTLRGTILGMVTSTGFYVTHSPSATDGSQKPLCVLGADTDASAANTVAPAYWTGEFADYCCTFGAGATQATVDAAFAASGQPIFIRTVGSVP